jgi:hypothetical protein
LEEEEEEQEDLEGDLDELEADDDNDDAFMRDFRAKRLRGKPACTSSPHLFEPHPTLTATFPL